MTAPVARNLAGNLAYGARRVVEPRSIAEVQAAVRGSSSLRVLGSRHAFNEIADTTGDHLSLARLPRRIEVDPASQTVTVDGGLRYGNLGPVLESAGFALHNLASLPHISVAGATATLDSGTGGREARVTRTGARQSAVAAQRPRARATAIWDLCVIVPAGAGRPRRARRHRVWRFCHGWEGGNLCAVGLAR